MKLPIATQSDHAIVIGIDPTLGAEEFRIAGSGGNVAITGGGPRGAMYGCDQFLETTRRALADAQSHHRAARTSISLPSAVMQQSPAFEYRETDIFEATEKDWAAICDSTARAIAWTIQSAGRSTITISCTRLTISCRRICSQRIRSISLSSIASGRMVTFSVA